MINKGLFEASEEELPKEDRWSPLLSNIMLNELDKELERRGLPFVRYADDSMIFCKSKRAAMRVKESITKFIEGKLYLKGEQGEDSRLVCAWCEIPRLLLLCIQRQMPTDCASQIQSKDEKRLKELTNRSNGWGYEKWKQKLEEYIRGWVGYYHLANMKQLLLETDKWLRRRIRMCIWKSWRESQDENCQPRKVWYG